MEVEQDNVIETDESSIDSYDSEDLEENMDRLESESESSSEEDIEPQISALEERIEQNEYDYESYISLIKLLRQAADLEKLRYYRVSFKKRFPMPTELWAEWINDEKLLMSNDSAKAVADLYESSMQDYYSIDLATDYMRFRQKYFKDDLLDFCRSMLNLFGRDVMRGYTIWSCYRSILQESQLVDLIRSSYLEQLSLPLYQNDKILESYIEWERGQNSEDCEKRVKEATEAFERSSAEFEACRSYEENLLSYRKDQYQDLYKDLKQYIELKLKEGKKEYVIYLYESFAERCCLVPDFWNDFCSFLYEVQRDYSYLLKTTKRAKRNLPGNAMAHVYYILGLELTDQPLEKLENEVNAAIQTTFQQYSDYEMVFLEAFSSYHRFLVKHGEEGKASFKAAISKVYSVLHEYYKNYESYLYNFDKSCAVYYSKDLQSYEEASKVFELILQTRSAEAGVWQDYIDHDRLYNNGHQVEQLYQRAMEQCQDYPMLIADNYLQYERANGTLDMLDACKRLIEQKRASFPVQQEPVALEKPAPKNLKNKKGNSKKRVLNDSDKSSKKQKRSTKEETVSEPPSDGPSKRQVKMQATMMKNDESVQRRTIFVKNLPYSYTKQQFEDLFKPYGPIEVTTLVCKSSGDSRGFGYIQFQTEEAAQKALEKNQFEVLGRSLEVEISVPATDRPQQKKEKQYHPTTVYVTNLPKNLDYYTLASDFTKYGKIECCHMVRNKNSNAFKGTALIQFAEPSSVEECLKMNNQIYRKKKIVVERSMYPAKQEEKKEPTTDA